MKKIYTGLALISLFAASTAFAGSASLSPLSDAEGPSGASCGILDKAGNFLVADVVRVNNTLVQVKLNAKVTKQSKSWSGDGFEASFTIPKGKLRETSQGFTVGKSPLGKLTFSYKGEEGSVAAVEECYGAD